MIRDITLTLRVITPLHIGTGRALTKNFDFVTKNGRTYRIREEGLIDEFYARDPKLTEQLMRTPPGSLLKSDDLQDNSPFVRYVLPGVPSGREFREQMKDSRDQPYIPGSSLKGALRTVLAWHGWKEKGLSLRAVRVGHNPKRAAQDIEAEIFGRDPKKGVHSPHHDLLRALRIADSNSAPKDTLAIENVNVWTKRGAAAPISVEAIKEGTEFMVQASIDESLFSAWASKARGFPLSHRNWLFEIPKIARARAAERLQREIGWWKGRAQPAKLSELQSALRNASDNVFPLQLGFGTGWEGTTIGAPLKRDGDWPSTYKHFRLGQIPRRRGATVPYEDFPSSRRVAVRNRTQVIPLGWVWVTWEEE